MKKLLLSFFVIAITGNIVLAQKAINDPNAEKRTVSSFHGIDVATGIELTLTEGSGEEVAVSASSTEFRDKIITKVDNGILKIYYETKLGSVNKKKESKDLKAYVSYKTLDMLNANTGAEVKINGTLKSAYLDLKANTGALVNGEVDINTLKVSQNTGSKVTLSGRADKLDIDGDTGSKFKGEEMSTSNCNITVSTGAMVSVKAEKELQIKANTGGIVKYKGNAVIKEIKTNTGGSVTKI
ncbi:MAG: head GIN domain-containing protein [Bacteroidota bacterium]